MRLRAAYAAACWPKYAASRCARFAGVVDRNTHERSNPMEIYQAYRAAAELNVPKPENANALNVQS